MRKHPFIFGGLLVFVAMLLIAAVNTGPNTGGSGSSTGGTNYSFDTNQFTTFNGTNVAISTGALVTNANLKGPTTNTGSFRITTDLVVMNESSFASTGTFSSDMRVNGQFNVGIGGTTLGSVATNGRATFPGLTNSGTAELTGFTRTYGSNYTSGELGVTNGFASYGSGNFRLGATDTNGTTNIVITSDFGGAVGIGTNAPQWALHVRSPNTNSLAVFDSGIGQVARIDTNTVTLNVSMSAPTNTAAHTTIAPANLHSITLGKGWTNDLGARADMVISVKYVDAATGDPKLAFTNSVTGEAWTNQVAFGITGTYNELVVIPDISPSDTGSFTDLSGTGASVTFLGAWWKLK